MGCNCGKNKDRDTQAQFQLKMPSGRTTKHATKRSAERMNERDGGGGTITRKA